MTRSVIQLHFDTARRLGPGKIELLECIEETGSISAAGRAMNMAYRRAWLLVDAMNQSFSGPVVATRLGGSSDGRARLTPLGRELVGLYRAAEAAARAAMAPQVTALEALLAAEAVPEKVTHPGRKRTGSRAVADEADDKEG